MSHFELIGIKLTLILYILFNSKGLVELPGSKKVNYQVHVPFLNEIFWQVGVLLYSRI